MLGTLRAALEVRQVKVPDEFLSCEVDGIHEIRERLPVLKEIHVRYRLRIPAGCRETVDRALAKHQERCPTAASLKGCIDVHWSAEIEEA